MPPVPFRRVAVWCNPPHLPLCQCTGSHPLHRGCRPSRSERGFSCVPLDVLITDFDRLELQLRSHRPVVQPHVAVVTVHLTVVVLLFVATLTTNLETLHVNLLSDAVADFENGVLDLFLNPRVVGGVGKVHNPGVIFAQIEESRGDVDRDVHRVATTKHPLSLFPETPPVKGRHQHLTLEADVVRLPNPVKVIALEPSREHGSEVGDSLVPILLQFHEPAVLQSVSSVREHFHFSHTPPPM